MKYESNNFQFEAEMPWESAGEGIVRQIMGYNDNLMMVKVKFETGAIGTPHTHPHTQTTYVASGVFEFTTDGETKIVRPGDGGYLRGVGRRPDSVCRKRRRADARSPRRRKR